MVVIQGNFEEKNEGQSKPNMYKGEDIDYYIFGWNRIIFFIPMLQVIVWFISIGNGFKDDI